MKEEQKQANRKEKKQSRFDFTFFLCIIGIFVLVVLAVTPAMLRMILPDRYVPSEPSRTPTPTPEVKKETLVCTMNENPEDYQKIEDETYTFENDRLVSLTRITTYHTENEATLSLLTSQCREMETNAQAVMGLQFNCDTSEAGTIKHQTSFDYVNLDDYSLEHMNVGIYTSFNKTSSLDEVEEEQKEEGYTCTRQ